MPNHPKNQHFLQTVETSQQYLQLVESRTFGQISQDTILGKFISTMIRYPIELKDKDGFNSSNSQPVNIYIRDVSVSDHSFVEGEAGCSFVVWRILVYYHDCITPIIKYKRYSQFKLFYESLLKEYGGGQTIPSLPSKDVFSAGRLWKLPIWFEERKRGLQWFLSNVLLNPRLQILTQVQRFLGDS